MKTSAIVIATALIGTPAFAADMPVKAPAAPMPAPVYNWTGFYVGVNAGASMGGVKTDFNSAPVSVLTSGGTLNFPGFSGPQWLSPSGFIGGGEIGYNWQYSPTWVLGFEADFQGADEKDSTSFSRNLAPSFTLPPVTATALTQYSAKIDWFGTVRGRIGYVWGNGNVMSYLTGGLAYARVDLEGTSTVSGTVTNTAIIPNVAVPFSVSHAIGHSHVNTGWVVGYGTEGVIDFWGARNWTWKVEGLYMDVGHLDDADAFLPNPCPGETLRICSTTGGQTSTHSHFTDGILRGGLNYKF